jgi:aspartate aminotransferase-like enzyme
MGLELVACDPPSPNSSASGQHYANTVTAIRYPPDIQHEDFARLMQAQYGLSIAGTYGPLAGQAFRVGPTGLMQIQRGFTMSLIGCMGMAFRQLGFHADVERALTAADAILATA